MEVKIVGRLFGTDGVRGIANLELTPEMAYKLGRFGAFVLVSSKKSTGRIIVGKDTRISGDMLESALIAGITSVGCDVVTIGVAPTPAVSYLVRELKADAGVVISASHNPVEYNGIKFFNQEGYKLPDEIEESIEEYILENRDVLEVPIGEDIGRISVDHSLVQKYKEFVKSTISHDLSGIKAIIDTANGAAFESAEEALNELGADIIAINNKPNGLNINKHCGSTHPEVVSREVRDRSGYVGLAFDGDADRLIAVDEEGDVVDGDKIMAICGTHLKKKNQLKNNTVVSTVMSNIGFDIALKEHEIETVKTKVGDRYVLESMKKDDYILGGEQSGHIIFLEHNTTGDGLLTAIQLLSVMKETGKTLRELAGVMKKYPQVLINAKVNNNNKNRFFEDDVISKKIKEVEKVMDGQGRVLVRPSGTEPLVRVMIEGQDEVQMRAHAQEIVDLMEERLA
jgi:phosphoglucosamine mutase